jgi:hypothetical protein
VRQPVPKSQKAATTHGLEEDSFLSLSSYNHLSLSLNPHLCLPSAEILKGVSEWVSWLIFPLSPCFYTGLHPYLSL